MKCRLSQMILATIVFFLMNVSLAAQDMQHAEADNDKPIIPGAVNSAEFSAPGQPKVVDREIRTDFNREWLESKGIHFNTSYRAETFGSLNGGVASGADYLGSADMTLAFTLNKMGPGRGHIVLSAQSLHRRGIKERNSGTFQIVSNLEERSFSKLIEAYYGDSYLGEKVTFKLGRLYANADFDVLDNAGDFLNASYGLIPTIPMPTYPAPQLGGSAWISPRAWVSVGGGVFRGSTLAPIHDTGTTTGKGVFAISEVKISPFAKSSAIHGTYHLGVWHQGNSTFRAKATDGDKPLANFGVYTTTEHWFRKPDSAGNNVGPGMFFQLGWSPKDRNSIHRYIGGGAAWPGLIPQRPRDSIGVGVTSAWIGGARHSETVTEIFYKLKVSSKVFVQPDLQYAYKPGGSGANRLLGGVRLGLEF